MKIRSKIDNLVKSINGYYLVTLQVPKIAVNDLFKLKDDDLDVDIKKHREKRSLDANGYLWSLCGKLADVLGSTKWEIYKHELKKWSIAYTYMIVEPSVARSMKERENNEHTDFRCVEILNESNLNGKPATQILAYLGSHLFDTKQMSVLLNGVVEDCKEQGIETETPEEISRLEALWQSK